MMEHTGATWPRGSTWNVGAHAGKSIGAVSLRAGRRWLESEIFHLTQEIFGHRLPQFPSPKTVKRKDCGLLSPRDVRSVPEDRRARYERTRPPSIRTLEKPSSVSARATHRVPPSGGLCGGHRPHPRAGIRPTNTRDKFSGGGGDSRPLPQIPASSGDGKKTQRTASVPIENCLTEGVQSAKLGSNL